MSEQQTGPSKEEDAPEDNPGETLSPSECLRGLSNVDLMQIADNGEVFQQFVRSMSGDSPSSGGSHTGAIPKQRKDWTSPGSCRPALAIPRRNNSSSSSLRVITHDRDAERNLRLYLQDCGREGKDRRYLLRQHLAKEEEDRREHLRLRRQLSEQAEVSLQEQFAHCQSYLVKATETTTFYDELDGSKPQKGPKDSPVWNVIYRRLGGGRRKRCPMFCCGDETEESTEEFLRRMDQIAISSAARSRGFMFRARRQCSRWWRNFKISFGRFFRSMCCFPRRSA